MKRKSNLKQPESESTNRVLFVEDFVELRELVTILLELNGFEVTEADDGQAALEIIEKSDGPWLALITDYNMPNFKGGQLIRAIRQQKNPFQSIIMTSTMITSYQDVQLLQLDGEIELLPKPYELNDLINLLKRLKNR